MTTFTIRPRSIEPDLTIEAHTVDQAILSFCRVIGLELVSSTTHPADDTSPTNTEFTIRTGRRFYIYQHAS